MLKAKKIVQLASAIGAAALLSASPLHAQTSSGASEPSSKSSAGVTSATQMSSDDRKMMENIAQANLAEIETGKMAVAKGQSDQVKKFGQKMIDDHTAALNELQQLAQSKGVTLPNEPDAQHKTMAATLDKLSGETFDKQYIARVGVGDHDKTHDLLQKTASKAKDPELKAYAKKTLTAVDQHLKMGKQMKGKS